MYKLGVDIGGTFTDVYVLDDVGRPFITKVPTNNEDLQDTFTQALTNSANILGLSLQDFLRETDLIINATTIATNAILERKGAKIGLITTAGFKDIIFIGKAIQKSAGLSQADLRDYFKLIKPDPIVPRSLVEEVAERVDYKGAVICPLDIDDAKRAIKNLADNGVEAIGVCLIWAFKNPSHEQRMKKLINEMYPHVPVSLSSEISLRLGEYERTATSAINTYILPSLNAYIDGIDNVLKKNGYKHNPLFMQSIGGGALPDMMRSRPVTTLWSGPAGGVMGAKFMGELLGIQDIITTDVGGTSFDVGIIARGETKIEYNPVISKYTLQIPRIDVTSIGAGGGSIAWVDNLGVLKVGPQSAGARPGPACYNLGGTEPTVTDADLILGYLNPEYFSGGAMPLNKGRALAAIETLSQKMKKDPIEIAKGIYHIVNMHCADLIRKFSIERGYDPRDFVLFAYGGAGPAHCSAYGKELFCKEIIIPLAPEVFSAYGLITSDILSVHELSDPRPLPLELERVKGNIEQLEKMGYSELKAGGVKEEDIAIKRFVSMKFSKQMKDLWIPIEGLTEEEIAGLGDKFIDRYAYIYGKSAVHEDAPIETTSYKVEVIGRIKLPALKKDELGDSNPSSALKNTREASFADKYITTLIYDLAKLKAGMIITGPAIIEGAFTTCVILPQQTARIDEYLNIRLEH